MKEIKKLVSRIETLTENRYEVDYNSNYGGYRLENKAEISGFYGCFEKNACCDRMNKKEFIAYLEGLIGGLKFNK